MKEDYTAASTFPSKLLHNKVIENGKIIPIHLQLIPTNRCNQTCSFCSCSDRRKDLELSLDKMKGIINTASQLGTKAITITGGGEPLMHKDLNEIIKYASELDIECGLTTNGYLLDRLEKHDNLTWCRISTSDEQKPAYDKISRANNLNPETDWAFSYVLSRKPNYENLQNSINFANKFNFSHFRLVSDLHDLENVPGMEEIKLNLQDDKKVIYQGRKDSTRGKKECYISLLKPLIAPEGIFPCCGVQYAKNGQDRDMIEEMSMGKMEELVDIISNQKQFDGSKCDVCYYSQYNEALKKLMEAPKHRRFV